jgi:hypothetical protein
MKYVVFIKYDPEDADSMVEKYRRRLREGDGFGKFPEILFGPYLMLDSTGGVYKEIQFVEVVDAEEMLTFMHYYTPELSVEFVPVAEAPVALEIWEKIKR